jgi:hypothetical protein
MLQVVVDGQTHERPEVAVMTRIKLSDIPHVFIPQLGDDENQLPQLLGWPSW